MLRSNLFLMGILLAGAATAQQTSDPAAAAPVVYDDGAPTSCGGGTYADADRSRCSDTELTGIDEADDATDDVVSAEGDEYADDAPVYGDTTEYYLGVSLYPDDYWVPGFGFGWPYYAYAPFAYGWPYYGFGFASWSWGWGWPGYGFAWWGGHRHDHDHHHHGGHDHQHGWHDHPRYASHAYPGPYRYLGHGRYANNLRATSAERSAVRADRGSTRTASLATAPRTGGARTGLSPSRRAILPSASYYAMARRSEMTPRAMAANQTAVSANRPAAMVNRAGAGTYNRADHAAATRSEAQRYAVTSLPSRRYAPSNYRSAHPAYRASNGYVAHNRGAPSYVPSRYGIANRAGYAGASRAPSYSHASGFAARSATGPAVHTGGGSPARASSGGGALPHRH